MNSTRTQSLLQIRDILASAGPAAAARAARTAYEAGCIHALDIPEVFLALQARSGSFFELLSTRAPGGSRFPFAPA